MRLYLPVTEAGLAGLVGAGEILAPPGAVVAPDDDEETEYAALMTAADASAALLDGPGRRVVVVAETDRADGPVRWDQVVAVHLDGDVDAGPDDDLAWFTPTEIRLGLAGG